MLQLSQSSDASRTAQVREASNVCPPNNTRQRYSLSPDADHETLQSPWLHVSPEQISAHNDEPRFHSHGQVGVSTSVTMASVCHAFHDRDVISHLLSDLEILKARCRVSETNQSSPETGITRCKLA